MNSTNSLSQLQTNATPDTGYLQVRAISLSNQTPIPNASIQILDADTTAVLGEAVTDENGVTTPLALPTPPIDYSMEPSPFQPYATYEVKIEKEGFESIVIDGAQILPEVTGEQAVSMLPVSETEPNSAESFPIGPHTLFGDYPPKIPENEIKPTQESGEIVLSRVVIPEYVVVHDGPPNDRSATDYYVRYRDYIKNVASSEIYATWPQSTITANVLAIMSFTLNRVYTEWYRGRGYQFTITSSTAYDHKWINERTIYDTISTIVDSIFNQYLSRPNVIQPILTQYCDRRNVTCPNWMTFLQVRMN